MRKIFNKFTFILLIFLLAISLFNSCKFTSVDYSDSAKWFNEIYNDTFTFKEVNKTGKNYADLIYFSSKLNKDVTFRRTAKLGFMRTNYEYYSNYNQLMYADSIKDYLIKLISPLFAADYEIDYDSNGLFLITASNMSYLITDFDEYKYISLRNYDLYGEELNKIDEETISIFIKTPENPDDMEKYVKNIVLNLSDEYVNKNIYIYFAADVASAKKNPGKETADRKYLLYNKDLFTREF